MKRKQIGLPETSRIRFFNRKLIVIREDDIRWFGKEARDYYQSLETQLRELLNNNKLDYCQPLLSSLANPIYKHTAAHLLATAVSNEFGSETFSYDDMDPKTMFTFHRAVLFLHVATIILESHAHDINKEALSSLLGLTTKLQPQYPPDANCVQDAFDYLQQFLKAQLAAVDNLSSQV